MTLIFLNSFEVYKQLLLNNGLCGLVSKGFNPWFMFMDIFLSYLLVGLMLKASTVAHISYGYLWFVKGFDLRLFD